jgi:hypothetical protein
MNGTVRIEKLTGFTLFTWCRHWSISRATWIQITLSKPILLSFHYTKRNVPPPAPVHINNVQLPQEEYIKYLGLHLDRRLTWHKQFLKMERARNHPHQNVLVTRTKVKTLYKQQTSHIWNNIPTYLDSRNTTLGYGFHFQHRNSRTFTIVSLVHDSGRIVVCAEYGYPKGSPNTNS